MTNLRYLRLKYDIYLTEIGLLTGISNQQISRIELGERRATIAAESAIQQAFEKIIAERITNLEQLQNDYNQYKNNLFTIRREG